MLTEAVFDSFGTVEDFGTLFPETAARFFAVNGVREPTITMRPGEVQRWRILHAGWQDDIFMELEGHTLNPIARDGIPLARMGLTRPAQARSAHRLSERHADGARTADRRAGAGGRARAPTRFRAVPYYQGYDAPTGPIARLVVEGDPLPMTLPAKLPPLPGRSSSATTRSPEAACLRFSAIASGGRAVGVLAEFRFTIDGKTFDPTGRSARSPGRRGGMDDHQRAAETIMSSISTPTICA